MASIQTTDEIRDILARLEGEKISALQVLGINSLKSLSPLPDALIGERITGTAVDDRTFEIQTLSYRISVDLQRTGRLVWLSAAEPYSATLGTTRPTVRVVVASGVGLDLREPAKTKRIILTLSAA